jgi:flagellar protein FliL
VRRWLFACFVLIGLHFNVAAEDSGVAPELIYFPMEPDLVTNYNRTGKRLGFIIVQVQLGTYGEANMELLEDHQPLIEDAILDLIGAMTHDQVRSVDEREIVRKQIETVLRALMKEETGAEIVEEVLFTKYTYQ